MAERERLAQALETVPWAFNPDTLESAPDYLAMADALLAAREGTAQPTCWCFARAAADGPCPVCVNADLDAQLTTARERVAELEARIAQMEALISPHDLPPTAGRSAS